MINKKIKNIICNSGSVWIMYNIENREPYFKKFITTKASSTSVCIVSKSRIDLFVNELDEYNLKDLDCKVWVYNKNDKLMDNILKVLEEMDFPENIYLNYSDSLDVSIDVLGHGLYSHITKNISKFYSKNKREVFYHSADNIIYELIESKSDEDIEYMKLSAKRALQIIEDVFHNIKAGMTEKEIFNLCKEIFNNKPEWFKDFKITDEKFSWDEEGCPIVLVGPNLKKGGHTLPSDQRLEKGYTVYLDFGVTLITGLGGKYSSDLQRMGYCLKDDESDAPNNYGSYSNKAFDDYIDIASTNKNNQIRMHALHLAENIFMNDNAIVPIYFYSEALLVSPKLKNVVYNALGKHKFNYCYIE